MRWGHDHLLWLALIPFLGLVLISYGHILRRQIRERIGDSKLAAALLATVSSERRLFKQLLQMLALVLVLLAVLRPQYGQRPETLRKTGIDIAIAFDISKSMLARDVQPSRIESARVQLKELMNQLSGDRVALVPFAGIAFTQSPLTADQGAIRLYMDSLDPMQMPVGGTNLSMAIVEGTRLLSSEEDRGDRSSRSRVLLLITDGEDVSSNQGEAAREAARKAAEAGIRIFAIAVGTRLGEPIPILDENGEHAGYQKGRNGKPVYSKLNMELLEELGRLADPEKPEDRKVFHLDGTNGVVSNLLAALNSLQKTALEAAMRHTYGEKFQYALLPALLLLLLDMVLGERRRRRDDEVTS